MKKMNLEEIINYINSLEGYQGYVQFSHREIDIKKDVFIDTNPKIENEKGFIYEAHFCNGKNSITIKQINDSFMIIENSVENIDKRDIDIFKGISNLKIKMAQIWEEIEDEDFDEFKVKKLKNVVFYGFKGDEDDNSTI